MLQQTQVATVIPYFERFIDRFPSVDALAEAPLDDVLHLWSGLGYYARARNLHKTAKLVIGDYKGVFPQTKPKLIDLPGIGRSTAGAILSLSMQQPAAILDGNVKRVLSRYFVLHGWPGNAKTLKELWALSEQLTPKNRTAHYNQAMMDLGSIVCTRTKPTCADCPLNKGCLARQNDLVTLLPTPKKRVSLPVKERYWLVFQRNTEVLLEQNPPTALWGGLWAFPEFETKHELLTWCVKQGVDLQGSRKLTQKRHTFSHYHLDYTLVICPAPKQVSQIEESRKSCWYEINSHVKIGIPAPVSQLIGQLANGTV